MGGDSGHSRPGWLEQSTVLNSPRSVQALIASDSKVRDRVLEEFANSPDSLRTLIAAMKRLTRYSLTQTWIRELEEALGSTSYS